MIIFDLLHPSINIQYRFFFNREHSEWDFATVYVSAVVNCDQFWTDLYQPEELLTFWVYTLKITLSIPPS